MKTTNILFPLVLLAAGMTADGEDWPAYQHDVGRSGATGESLEVDSLAPVWSWRSPHPPRSAWHGPAMWDAYAGIRDLPAMRDYDAVFHVVAVDGRVYFGSSADDTVRCLDAADGQVLWRFTADGPVRLAPACAEGRVYFGSDDGCAYCLDAVTGEQVWRACPEPSERLLINNGRLISPRPVRTGVLVDGGMAYFAAALLPWESGWLCAVDAESGRFDVPGGYRVALSGKTLEGPPAATADQLVFPQGRVAPQLFRRSDGADLGMLRKSSGGSIVVLAGQQVLHGPGADSRRGTVAASALDSRQRVATFGRGRAMVVDGGAVYMLADQLLAAAQLADRKPLWRSPCGQQLALIKAGDALIAGGVDEVAAYDAGSGRRLWRHAVPGRAKGLAVAGGRLLVSTDEGAVIAFAPRPKNSHTAPDLIDANLDASLDAASDDEALAPVPPVDDEALIGRWVMRRDQMQTRRLRDLSPKSQAAQVEGDFRIRSLGDQQVMELDGETTSLQISSDLRRATVPTQSLTAEAVVRVDQPLEWGGLIGAIQDNGSYERGWLLGFRESRFSLAVCSNQGPGHLTYLTADRPFRLGRWHHVVGTYNGKQMRLYVDGRLAGESDEQQGELNYPPQAFFEIGAYHDQNEHHRLRGQLQEVRLYSRELSAAEIAARAEALADTTLAILASSTRPTSQLAAGPWLSFADDRHAVVRWETERPSRCTLSYGLEDGPLREAAEDLQARTSHQVRIGPLRRDRVYRYHIEVSEPGRAPFRTVEHPCDTFFNYCRAVPPLASAASAAERSWYERQAPTRGLCLIWGADLADLAPLVAARHRVLLVDDDREKIAAVRQRWLDADSYGASLATLVVGSLDRPDPRLPGDWANLILATGDAKWLAGQLKPGGGVLLQTAPLPSSGETSPLAAPDGRSWWRLERPALEGAGQWTHLYGLADNAAFGGETLGGASSTDQLQVQWIGRPGPRYQADRSGRKPSPLAANGRLLLQGWRRIVALDAHNGEPLWSAELPELERFNVPRDCSNWCIDDRHVFAAVRDRLWQFDASDGRLLRKLSLPQEFQKVEDESDDAAAQSPAAGARPWNWGYAARVGGRVLGTAVRREAPWTNFWGNASAGWYDAKSGEVTAHIASDMLMAYDADPVSSSAEAIWRYRGLILNSTITADSQHIWLLEAGDPQLTEQDGRRLSGEKLWSDLHLVCLEVATGQRLWRRKLDVAPGEVMVSMSHAGDHLVLVTSGANKFHVYSFDAGDGERQWQAEVPWTQDNHGGHMSRPAIVGDVVYVRPAAFALGAGTRLPQQLPGGGCGTYACTADALFFRQSTVAMWSREDASLTSFPRLRPDCWLSTIPASGMLLSPEGGGGCSCGNWLETSLGLKRRR